VGNVVVLRKFLRVEGLAARGGTSHENLDGVESAELVELVVELLHVADDALLAVPRELELLQKFLLLFLFKVFVLLRREFTVLESIGCLHLQVG
jgi:hypothetical protein